MILGFAHLAVNVPNLLEAEVAWRAEGYTRNAIYLTVPNHPSKQRFLSTYELSHDLMLMSGPDLWPLELTCHGVTRSINTQLKWGRESICITVPAPASLQRLLVEGLGFRVTEDGILSLDGRFPGWSCLLRLQTGYNMPISLDSIGPTCLAFYCNRTKDDVQRLIDLGATDPTDPFDIVLGPRSMKIVMLRAPGGLLLELIDPRKKI